MEMDIKLLGGKKVSAEFKGLRIATDQPQDAGGEGSAPSPFDLFLASLGTCAGFYIQSFCQKRDIPTEGITLKQRMDLDPETHMVKLISLSLSLPKDFPEKYRAGVIGAANLCLVKKHLQQPPQIELSVKPA
ncbi:MAG: OsmC family protein [Elusimicrobia bacterium]|jgi:ribosomal protein S12 methylthiotransferase accessory factor|nr:OsmC family protein [Elusimicrobiota bacterium]